MSGPSADTLAENGQSLLQTDKQTHISPKNAANVNSASRKKCGEESVTLCKHGSVFAYDFLLDRSPPSGRVMGSFFLHVSDLVRNFRKSIEKHGSVTMTTVIISEKVINPLRHETQLRSS